MTPKLRYDREADDAHLHLSDAVPDESEEVAPGIILDFEAEGHIVGIEILRASTQLATDTLAAADEPLVPDVKVELPLPRSRHTRKRWGSRTRAGANCCGTELSVASSRQM